jgi:hypothetical protein
LISFLIGGDILLIDINDYDNCLGLAESLNIYSVKGNPHSHFIGAILKDSNVKCIDNYVFNMYDNIVGENKYYIKADAKNYIRGYLKHFNISPYKVNSIRINNKNYKVEFRGAI